MLDANAIEAILDTWAANTATQRDLAAQYGVTVAKIEHIFRKARWGGDPRAAFKTRQGKATLCLDLETPMYRLREMDAAFCKAMSAAIEAGLERLPVVDLNRSARLPKTYYPESSSYCGSPAGMCADIGGIGGHF